MKIRQCPALTFTFIYNMTNFHDDLRKNKKALLNLVGKCIIGMNGLGNFRINNMRKQIVSSGTVPHSLVFYQPILTV